MSTRHGMGIARVASDFPKHVRLSYEVDMRLGEWLRSHPGGRPEQFAQLIELGLRNSANEETSKALHSLLVELHFLAQAAAALDEPPHPRPATVDPKVWELREADRVRKVREHQARAARDLERMAGTALRLVRGADQ